MPHPVYACGLRLLLIPSQSSCKLALKFVTKITVTRSVTPDVHNSPGVDSLSPTVP